MKQLAGPKNHHQKRRETRHAIVFISNAQIAFLLLPCLDVTLSQGRHLCFFRCEVRVEVMENCSAFPPLSRVNWKFLIQLVAHLHGYSVIPPPYYKSLVSFVCFLCLILISLLFFLPFSLEFASVSISVSVSVPVSVFVSVWAGNAGGSLVVGLAVTPPRRLVALVPAPPPLPAAVAAAVVVVVAAVAGLNTSCQLKWRICTFFFLLDAIMAMVMNCGNWRWINRWWRPC